MMRRAALIALRCGLCAGLALALSSCGRRAEVGAEDAKGDPPGKHGPVSRGKTPDEDPAAGKGAPFRFADDAGGAALARLLPPSHGKGPLPDRAPGPRRTPPSGRLAAPASPLPASRLTLPRVAAVPKRAYLRPRLVLEEALDEAPPDPVPPRKVTLPAGDRVRAPAHDPNRPLPLPGLAQPVPDRASLEDPTADVSGAAVLSARMPLRTRPAPFLRLTLPDPYEFRRPLNVGLPAESQSPATGTPRKPQ